MIQVDPLGTVPVYQQIVDQVCLAVVRGELHPGDRLEPVRGLAERLAVNPSTVARAYQILERDGIIETNRRRGSQISQSADPDAVHLRMARDGRLRGLVERTLVEALAQGYRPEEFEAALSLQLAAWRERLDGPGAHIQGLHNGIDGAPQARPSSAALRFAGSHDLALEALLARLRLAHPGLSTTTAFVGSLDGLLALLHGEADLAGTHILDEATGEWNLPILQRIFPGRRLASVTLAEREQGLIVARGNPHHLAGWRDLAQPGLRLVNRQPGSGTRTLLDLQLRRAGIAAEELAGYDSVAETHLAAAAAVAEGEADVALGLYAAARAHDLGFVPLSRERYDLVFADGRASWLFDAVLDVLRSAEFRAVVTQMGGYDTRHMGEEVRP